jgi:hypothetical protein
MMYETFAPFIPGPFFISSEFSATVEIRLMNLESRCHQYYYDLPNYRAADLINFLENIHLSTWSYYY